MVEETEDQAEVVEAPVEYDWDRINLLLKVHHELRGYPNLMPLADAAMRELNALANPPAEPGEEDEVTEAEHNPAPTERKKEEEEEDE